MINRNPSEANQTPGSAARPATSCGTGLISPPPAPQAGHRVYLVFQGVAWEANVWLNGVLLGSHQGYWEPFRFDVTSLLKTKNLLAVRVLNGEKLGEPVPEWSVLPFTLAAQPRFVRNAAQLVIGQRELFGFQSCSFRSGYGIHREVYLETTGNTKIAELLVRGELGSSTANIQVATDAKEEKPLTFKVQIMPENFTGRAYSFAETRLTPGGKGAQSFTVPTPDFHLWQPTDPCLYRCRITLFDGNQVIDAQDTLFGYRSFRLATADDHLPNIHEGMFMLNGKPVFLRGAGGSSALNAFWYWHQDDKLLDTVLMMKAANFNAVRANEHIQFPEVRELMDRLGMLTEQDMSGAGTVIPVSVVAELCGHLARECYNNPSVVLLTAGMESTCDPTEIVKSILVVDPERIIKPISGNMLDWNYGLPPGYPKMPREYWSNVVDDFHNYSGWYRRGARIDTLCQLYPAGRMVTVGEFGAEGMDAYSTMQRYPTQLQPPPIDGEALWGSAQVKKGDPKMIEGLRGQLPKTLGQYITASQTYQAEVMAEQATGLRLSPRRIGGYFEFHFIDGLPAHWPKSIVSFDLTPKKAYFAMAQVNQPIVPLFQLVDEGKTLALWVANDSADTLSHYRVLWRIEAAGKTLLKGEKQGDAQSLDATAFGNIDISQIFTTAPVVSITLTLLDAGGTQISIYQREVYLPAYQPPHYTIEAPKAIRIPNVPEAMGDPSKVNWTVAAALTGWRQAESDPTQHVIEAQIGHDEFYLYLKLSEAMPTTNLQSDDGIWSGEDWEVLFSAQRSRPFRQFGINPKGAYLEVASDTNLTPCGAKVVSELAKDHWTVLVAFPLSTLVPGGLKSGSVFYGNFCRTAGSGDVYREFLAWSPNYAPSYLLPERFAELTLE